MQPGSPEARRIAAKKTIVRGTRSTMTVQDVAERQAARRASDPRIARQAEAIRAKRTDAISDGALAEAMGLYASGMKWRDIAKRPWKARDGSLRLYSDTTLRHAAARVNTDSERSDKITDAMMLGGLE